MKRRHKTRAKTRKNHLSVTQKIILSVIILAFITIIISLIASFLLRPENTVKSKVEALASDYYENYIYESILNSDNFSGNIEETLAKYTEIGLSPIPLRELILHDITKTADIAPFLTKYCNENQTLIKFYPQPPFHKTSYRTEYVYSCEF